MVAAELSSGLCRRELVIEKETKAGKNFFGRFSKIFDSTGPSTRGPFVERSEVNGEKNATRAEKVLHNSGPARAKTERTPDKFGFSEQRALSRRALRKKQGQIAKTQ